MRTLTWTCPGCGGSIESEGHDESSRSAINAYRQAHRDH